MNYRGPVLALWDRVTLSYKTKISPFRLFIYFFSSLARTGSVLHFTKTLQRSILSDLVIRLFVRQGCHFRAPAGRALWWGWGGTAFSSRTFWHRTLIMSLLFPSSHKRSHRPNVAIKLKMSSQSAITCCCPFCCIFFPLVRNVLDAHFAFTAWWGGILFSQCDELHLTVPGSIDDQLVRFIAFSWWEHFGGFAKLAVLVDLLLLLLSLGPRSRKRAIRRWPKFSSRSVSFLDSWRRRVREFSGRFGAASWAGSCQAERLCVWFEEKGKCATRRRRAPVHSSAAFNTHTCAHCSRVKFSYLMALIDRPLWVMMFSLSQRVAHSGRLQTGFQICFVWIVRTLLYIPLYESFSVFGMKFSCRTRPLEWNLDIKTIVLWIYINCSLNQHYWTGNFKINYLAFFTRENTMCPYSCKNGHCFLFWVVTKHLCVSDLITSWSFLFLYPLMWLTRWRICVRKMIIHWKSLLHV